MSLAVTTTAFTPGGAIPKNYTCDGAEAPFGEMLFASVHILTSKLAFTGEFPGCPNPVTALPTEACH